MNKTIIFIILLIIIILFFLYNKDKKEVISKGYGTSEYKYISGDILSIHLRGRGSFRSLLINWALPENSENITDFKFINVSIKNIETGKDIASNIYSQEKLKTKLKSYSGEVGVEQPFGIKRQFFYWQIENNEGLLNQMDDFVDYQLSGTIVKYQGSKEFERKDFLIFLKRDYKKNYESDLDYYMLANSSHRLYSKEGKSEYKITNNAYYKEFFGLSGRLISTINYGEISIENGKLVFKENSEKREAFYRERDTVFPNKSTKYKRIDVDNSKYEYKTIYEKGYVE